MPRERREANVHWVAEWQFIQSFSIRTILDVGANTGQFAGMIRGLCPAAEIHSFEPLSGVFEALEAEARNRAGWRTHRMALGEAQTIHRSAFAPSSSLLEMAPAHKRIWPESSESQGETIAVHRLDDVFAGCPLAEDILIKLDVQGFEAAVIRGGFQTFGRARVVVSEVAFEELYHGQASFAELYELLGGLGFEFRGCVAQFRDPETREIVFADVLFLRADRYRKAKQGTGLASAQEGGNER